MKRVVYLSVALLSMMVCACSDEFAHPDVSGIDVEVKVHPFYQDLLPDGLDAEEKSKKLSEKYGEYFRTYCKYEIRVGDPLDSLRHDQFLDFFGRFLTIDENAEVLATCDSVFAKQNHLESELTDAFKCFKYYFPDKTTPEIYVHFSGFNDKIFVDSTYLSFSIEHYLGNDCRYYPMLEIPVYARQSKTPVNIVPDLVKAWLLANFPDESEQANVLSALIYNGKILYAQKKCMPDLSWSTLFGLTDEQLKWCERNEESMWRALIDQRLLYSTNPLDRNKLVNETPFTTFFGQDSPGRAALYCAFNIVRLYVEENPDMSLEALLMHGDAQQLLIGAHYAP